MGPGTLDHLLALPTVLREAGIENRRHAFLQLGSKVVSHAAALPTMSMSCS